MIAYLDGFLIDKNEEFIIIDVNGVGYSVLIPEYLYYDLPEINSEYKIHIYHHFREDNQSLYGFKTKKEKSFFELLVSVSGIGPKKGLKLISQSSFGKFIIAIKNEDISYLSSLSGVGKKTAKKLILELKDKVKDVDIEFKQEDKNKNIASEAIEVLINLGFSPPEARNAIGSINVGNEEYSVQDFVKLGLRKLGKGK